MKQRYCSKRLLTCDSILHMSATMLMLCMYTLHPLQVDVDVEIHEISDDDWQLLDVHMD